MKNIREFIRDHGISMSAVPVPDNPHSEGDWHNEARHYHCTISHAESGRVMTTYYSVGPGVVEHWAKDHGGPGREVLRMAPRSVAAAEYLAHEGLRYLPDLSDVLDCLASDASMSRDDFEDWAGNCGYDTDSRAAERIYKVVRRQTHRLKSMLGAEAFSVLLNDIERE